VELRIVVFGTPGPQGSKRLGDRGQVIESSKKVAPWRAAVHDEALNVVRCRCGSWGCGELVDGYPMTGPLVARMVFTLRKPTSAPKRRRTWPSKYPDVSKLARATEDALTGVAWKDDAQVVEYDRLAKVFPGEDPEALDAPGALIVVRRVVDSLDLAVTP
jgi:hypothetical protein